MASIVNLRKGFRNNFKSGLLSKLTYDHWAWLTICHIRGNVGILVSPERAPIRCTDSFSFAMQATIIARCKLCLSLLYRPVLMWHCQMFKECTHILKPMFIWSCRLKLSADDTHATEPLATQIGSIPNWHIKRERVVRNQIVSGKRRTSHKFWNCYVNKTNVLYKDVCSKFFCLNVSKRECRIFSFQRWQTERKHHEIFRWR